MARRPLAGRTNRAGGQIQVDLNPHHLYSPGLPIRAARSAAPQALSR